MASDQLIWQGILWTFVQGNFIADEGNEVLLKNLKDGNVSKRQVPIMLVCDPLRMGINLL